MVSHTMTREQNFCLILYNYDVIMMFIFAGRWPYVKNKTAFRKNVNALKKHIKMLIPKSKQV